MRFKNRDLFPSLLALLVLGQAVYFNQMIHLSGLVVILVANLLRIWTRTWVGEHTRLRTLEVPHLETRGPFALSRNPLYLSNLLVSLGWLVLLGYNLLLVVVWMIVIWRHWHLVVQEEEAYLQQEFSDVYGDYCSRVPRWIRWPQGSQLQDGGVFQIGETQFLQALRSDTWTWVWQLLSLMIAWVVLV